MFFFDHPCSDFLGPKIQFSVLGEVLVAILESKKWVGHCGAKEKVEGANINVYLAR